MAASAVVMLAGLWTISAPGAWGAVTAISVVTFGYSCWAANVLTLPADAFESGAVGTAAGLCGSAAGVGGMISTLTIGWVVDRWSYAPAFVAAAVAPVIAASLVLYFVRRREA